MGFCTQCGSSLDRGVQFCTHCGAATPQPAPSGSAHSSTAAAVQPVLEPTASLPHMASPIPSAHVQGSASRLLIVGVFIVMVGVAGVGYFLISRPQARVPAPIVDGSSATASSSLQTYGLEKYPGARPLPLNASGEPDAITAFETSDSPEQVIGYYRVRFPVAQVDATEESSILTADMGGRQVEVRAEALANGSRVTIRIPR